MCLPIDCWLCTPRTDDDNGNGNGGHYYNGNGYPAHGAVAGGEADRKALSNDVNVRRGPAAHAGAGAAAVTRGWHGHGATAAHAVPTVAGAGTAATRGWHGHGHGHAHAATSAQEKQADGTLKPQPVVARNDKVAAADGRKEHAVSRTTNYYYEQPPAHKEDAADSYYPAATATADHESPSEALGEK